MQPMIGSITMLAAAGLTAALMAGCSSMGGSSSGDSITQAPFGAMKDGRPVEIFTLRNAKGAEARIMTYGGIVVSLKVPDRNGQIGDVTLGFDTLDGYLADPPPPYFGALIGRYGNRIGKGKFTLDGTTYQLATNNNGNTLHGGNKGYDKVLWTAVKAKVTSSGPALTLNYVSKDMEEGYPGTLNITAVYTLTDDNALQLVFTATTDKDTVLNLTHHSYFNLAGKGNILDHQVWINSDMTTPVDEGLIPTGEFAKVDGTPFDFRTATSIGARIDQVNEQLKFGKGYDHNWVIKKEKAIGQLEKMAVVTEPNTGRVMEVWSTEPGLQFYSGNFLDGTITGKGGWKYQFRNAFCMEPQHYPDSPNKPNWPTTELKPGDVYHNTIIYKFSTK
jgi:aldose 1-epimerase